MAYAQRSYSQLQGINGKYPISLIGCFVTSFCNLEADFGNSIAPDALDNFFKQRGYYVDVDDGIRDDLSWDTITKFDGLTRVITTVDHGTAQTAGWPNSDRSIVRFYYRSSQTGQMTYHFCKVASAGSHTIIDSYDGKLKASPYGEPTAWASYSHDVPKAVSVAPPPVTYQVSYTGTTNRDLITTKNPTNWYELNGEFSPLTTIPEGTKVPVAGIAHWSSSTGEVHDFYMTPEDFGNAGNTGIPNKNNGISTDDLKELPPPAPYKPPEVLYVPKPAETYELVTDLLCYPDAQKALISTTPSGELKKGKYYVFGRDREMINLSTSNMHDQNQWINPRQNVVVVEEPKPAPVPTPPAPKPEPKPEPVVVTASAPVPDITTELESPVDYSWKACYPLFDDRLPTKLVSSNTIPVKIKALDGKLPEFITLPAHKPLDIVSWFEKGGVRYYRDVMLDEAKRFYALPVEMFPDPYNTPKLDTNRDGDITISDFIDYAGRYGTKVFKSGVAVVSTAAKAVPVQKFIDGFKSGKKTRKIQ